MTQKKTTTPRTRKAKTNPMRVCVLACENGENLIVRSNPSPEDIQGFVKSHHERNPAQTDQPTYRIMSATYFESEYDIGDLAKAGATVELHLS